MAIKVTFYTFSKRVNSTLQPTGSGTEYDCTFLDGADILQPTVKLNVAHDNTVTAFNYCYIADFNRYYFVQRWFFDNALWHAILSVDPLASWKTSIGTYNGYVLRASAAYTGSIKDTFYPAKANPQHVTKAIQLTGWTDSLAAGSYVVGVISGSGVGSVNYYVMDPSEFTAFTNAVYANTGDWMNSAAITDITTDLLKTLFNPFEYIVSVMWFPLSVPHGTSVASIPLGWWSVPATGAKLVSDVVPLVSYNVTPDQHPQAATRGTYLNSAPYTSITLDFQPFGLIPLDASIVCGNQLTLNLYVDYITGTSCLHITVNKDSTTSIIYSAAAQVGVPIQISGRQPSVGSMITGAVSAFIDNAQPPQGGLLGDVAHVAGAMFTELSGGRDLQSSAAGVMSAISTGLKRMSSTGSNGSRAQLLDELYISQDFLLLTDEKLSSFGRPLYESRQISTIGGYIQMGDANISFPGMAEEISAVRGHMIKGFYYE